MMIFCPQGHAWDGRVQTLTENQTIRNRFCQICKTYWSEPNHEPKYVFECQR